MSTLGNGMRVVLVRDPRASDVQVTMRYRVGGANDPVGKEGMAHLVEHLMFEQVLGNQTIFARLEERAASFNAYTSWEATTFVTRAHLARLSELLSIEAVRVGFRCVSITEDVFMREREIVRNEIVQRDYGGQIRDALHGGLYPSGHPYRRAIAGTVETLASITKDEACAFADRHYTPSNGVLVVSGAIDPRELEAALGKFLGKVAARPAPPALQVDPVAAAPATSTKSVSVPAPIDDRTIVVAWPVPSDPVTRARVRALRGSIVHAVGSKLDGRVVAGAFGDVSAPLAGLVIVPDEDETTEAVRAAVVKGLAEVARTLADRDVSGRIAFHQIQQGAVRDLFFELEADGARDEQLATSALANLDPGAMLGAQIKSLRAMTASDAIAELSRSYAIDRATMVVLQPGARRPGGARISREAPIHDMNARRDPPDPADAKRPDDAVELPPPNADIVWRELPNGLDVVLAPITSVPTVEARLVFHAGTAHDSEDARGAALVAGYGLSWDWRYVRDLAAFAQAGGVHSVSVDRDATAFVVRGLDMHLDYLLTGLRRVALDGTVDKDVLRVVRNLRERASDDSDELDEVRDALGSAIYGGTHPYRYAGVMRQLSPTLSFTDAQRFRKHYFRPDNATLVIAGHFDAALANQWIDHLFGGWSIAGDVGATRLPPAASTPASIAIDDDTAQVMLSLSLPVHAGKHAQQLVAASMLAEVAGDVRQQLGASYGLQAYLSELRFARSYEVSGRVDAARTADALRLLSTRLDALRTDPDAAARTFVRARKRVLSNLTSMTSGATEIAERVQHDVVLGRPPLAGAGIARDVRALTVDRMTQVLAELDLSRATIVLRGPREHVDAGFATLERSPTWPSMPAESTPAPTTTLGPIDEEDLYEDLTSSDRPPRRLTFGMSVSWFGGTIYGEDVGGSTLTAQAGYRVTRSTSVGLQGSLGSASGTYDKPYDPLNGPMTLSTRAFEGFVQITWIDRISAGGIAGLRFDELAHVNQPPVDHVSVTVGAYVGIDVVSYADHRFTVYGRAETEFISTPMLTWFGIGIGYRR